MKHFGECTLGLKDGSAICKGDCQAGEKGVVVITVSQWAGNHRIKSKLGLLHDAQGGVQEVEILCYDEGHVELLPVGPVTTPEVHSVKKDSGEVTGEVMDRLHHLAAEIKQGRTLQRDQAG